MIFQFSGRLLITALRSSKKSLSLNYEAMSFELEEVTRYDVRGSSDGQDCRKFLVNFCNSISCNNI